MNNLAFLPIAITFLGFALTLMLRHDRDRIIVSLGTAFLYVCFGVWSLFGSTIHLPLHLEMGSWQAPFGISLVYDHLSALLVTVTGFIYFAVTLYAATGDNVEDSPLLFPLIHVLVCGISGAFMTGDLFNLYVWFEVILLSSFVLFSLGDGSARLVGAFKYVVLNILSSLIFLAAAGLIYNAVHTLNFAELGIRLRELSQTHPTYVLSLNVLIFVAFAIKSALFPFFFWLPASYHTLSPAVSALFAGILTKVGLYAIFRVNLFTFPESSYMQIVLGSLACLSILVGVAGAIVQTNIRKILGFHIISQVGYIALAGIFAFSPDENLRIFGISAALFYMAHHILVKTNLFLVAGLVRSVTGYENLAKMSGLVSRYGFVAVLFAVPALSLAGIPPFSGFWAKLGLFQASLSSQQFLPIAAMIIGGFFTVFSMAKIWLAAFWGKPAVSSNECRPPSLLNCLPCVLLCALTITVGLYPDLLFSHAELAAKDLVEGWHHGD